MNKSISCRLALGARIIVALCAGFFLIPTLHAQPTEETVEHRVLLVFDTSAEMKRRLPEVQAVLKDFFYFEGSGQMREGDTIGVWTFGQDVHAGEFPLQNWSTDEIGPIVTNIVRNIGKLSYAKETRFDQILPMINKLAQNSERLTVLIFCDGTGDFQGTPFDASINQIFQERNRAAKKARVPFVIVLRSQLGQYIGSMVNFPRTTFNLPTFPPLPLPPPPPPPPVVKPPPRVVLPPLIIVGTTVGTNFPPPKPKVEITNAPPPMTNLVTTNMVVLPSHSGLSSGGALGIALSLLAAATVMGILAWRRSRHSDSASLITRSLNRD